jgi:hypothetical protein
MSNRNSGQIRIIEAFLAALIIFSSFAISSNLSVRQNVSENVDLAPLGLQTLAKLDSDGRLGKYIDYGNWTALRDALDILLPPGLCFNLTVYDDHMHQINAVVISNGGFGSQQIAFVQYVCVSQSMVFHCYIIHLNLAVAT